MILFIDELHTQVGAGAAQDRLAMQLLAGEFSEGDTIKVDVADGDLVFRKVVAAEPEPAQVLPEVVQPGPCPRCIGEGAGNLADNLAGFA